ncbi:MAG: choice-of-anchor B family protein [Saprospiraceae bacterium]|nr:choice-of-anchor B family protein [Saprospiraceae bacterium]
MSRLLYACLVALFAFNTTQAQLNVELVAQLDYQPTLNDIWGYVAPDSTEYALVGLTEGLSIVSLEDPANPVEVAFIEGQSTTWRDIKTWDQFAYVVSDNASEGMLVVDMQFLPDSVQFAYTTGPIDTLGNHLRSHNIYIDEYGLAYLAGSNLGSIIILDVKSDPWNPVFVAKTPSPYAHDVYARDSIVYTSEIYEGRFAAYDIRNTDSIRFLGSAITPFAFTHNAWLSDDSKTIFTTDERANAYVTSFDISDFSEIKELDRFRPAKTLGESVIPHNVHVWDDYLIISYYTDGCIVVDASRPDNLVEVGNFDTFLGASGGFSGAWGAYPFLPSGTILVSDRQSGLYVLTPNYVRGCYLEGRVFSAEESGNGQNASIFNAEIQIISDEIVTPDFSDPEGLFKMGKAVPGEYMIRVSHPEYIPAEVPLTFENGVVTEVEVYLEPKQRFQVSGRVLTSAESVPVAGAMVVASDGTFLYETATDAEGQYSFGEVFEGSYQVFAGVWGQYSLGEFDLNDHLVEDIYVSNGYYDDFHFDFGWTVSGTAVVGHWERAVPVESTLFGIFECNPSADLPDDIGERAFVTYNNPGNAGSSDVDDGFTLLSSPPMDLSGMNDPVVSFNPWLCIRFPDVQSFFVLASNAQDTVTIDTIFTDGNEGYWRPALELHLKEYLTPDAMTQVHFMAVDTVGNIVEAAVDRFVVFDAETSAVKPVAGTRDVIVYPNPARDRIMISLEESLPIDIRQVSIFNSMGQQVFNQPWPSGSQRLEVPVQWTAGMYFLRLTSGNQLVATRKVVISPE